MQLRVSLGHDGAARHAKLLRRTAELAERIESFQPSSRAEMDELFDHLARRRVEGAMVDPKVTLRLSELLRRDQAHHLPREVPHAFRGLAVPDPLPSELEGEALADLVLHSTGRLSAVDTAGRFLTASMEEARACGMVPGALEGRHLLEVIGCGAPQSRQMKALRVAVQGRAHEWICPPDGAGRQHRARLSPVTCGGDTPYAVLRLIEPWDQTSPGTT